MARHKVKVAAVMSAGLGFERLIETAKRYEAEGLSDLVWPDHLMGLYPQSIWTEEFTPLAKLQKTPNVYFDVMAVAAAVAMATSRIGLQLGVTEPFRRHPAMLAQEALTLDHISKGRFVLGLGSGEGENIIPYGIDFKKPVTRLEEALKIIRLLWSTDQPVNFDGEIWKLKDAVLGLRPYGEKPPQIWLAAMGPRMLDLCARYADGWIPVKPLPENYGPKLAKIKELGAKYGRDLSNMPASMIAFSIILNDHDEIHKLMERPLCKAFALGATEPEVYEKHGAQHPFGHDFRGLQHYIPTNYTKEDILEAVKKIPFEVVHDSFFHGTPDEICEQLENYADQGLNHVQMMLTTGIWDLNKLPQSIEGLIKVNKYFNG